MVSLDEFSMGDTGVVSMTFSVDPTFVEIHTNAGVVIDVAREEWGKHFDQRGMAWTKWMPK